MSTDVKTLAERLREWGFSAANNAADLIEQQAAALKKANAQTEHFEREWYLRGDMIEQQAAEIDGHRVALAAIFRALGPTVHPDRDTWPAAIGALRADAERYRWLRGGADIPLESNRWARWEVRYWCGRWWSTMFADQLDTAIDAARGQE